MADRNDIRQQQQDSPSGSLSYETAIGKWKEQEDNRLLLHCLKYLDAVSLIQKKSVCKTWQTLCTESIDNKCDLTSIGGSMKKKFETNEELTLAVGKYCTSHERIDNELVDIPCTPKAVEVFASTYGYPIDKWDVSNVTDFSRIFDSKRNFNEPIGSWDVSKATTIQDMFYCAKSFNQDISTWDISNVTNMSNMLYGASSFDQDISSWDVSNATTMLGMFEYATSFTQDISSWAVSNATTMECMFHRALSFDQDISSWDVSNVTNMSYMFYGASSFNQDLSSWDVSRINDFGGMFQCCPIDARQLPWFNEDMLNYW